MFPFALTAPGRFQLRLSAMSLPKMLKESPRIWRGHTPRTRMLDLQCKKAEVKFDR